MKKKEEKKKSSLPAEAANMETDYDNNILLSVISSNKRSKTEWIIDSGCTFHMCLHRDLFTILNQLIVVLS